MTEFVTGLFENPMTMGLIIAILLVLFALYRLSRRQKAKKDERARKDPGEYSSPPDIPESPFAAISPQGSDLANQRGPFADPQGSEDQQAAMQSDLSDQGNTFTQPFPAQTFSNVPLSRKELKARAKEEERAKKAQAKADALAKKKAKEEEQRLQKEAKKKAKKGIPFEPSEILPDPLVQANINAQAQVDEPSLSGSSRYQQNLAPQYQQNVAPQYQNDGQNYQENQGFRQNPNPQVVELPGTPKRVDAAISEEENRSYAPNTAVNPETYPAANPAAKVANAVNQASNNLIQDALQEREQSEPLNLNPLAYPKAMEMAQVETQGITQGEIQMDTQGRAADDTAPMTRMLSKEESLTEETSPGPRALVRATEMRSVSPQHKPQAKATILPPEPGVGKAAPSTPLPLQSVATRAEKRQRDETQGQMSSPIQIDQTQLPTSVRASQGKKSVTIQDLNVSYEKLSFMTPLEIVYYKLLRAALKQYLIFPRVSSKAVVKATSSEPEHQKIADNILGGTSLSFIVCDVRLNVRAIVEVVDESVAPTNKEKARDYILKKAGCLLVRFYSGDKPPDVDTLRTQIIGSI
jgi:hypothetical protein